MAGQKQRYVKDIWNGREDMLGGKEGEIWTYCYRESDSAVERGRERERERERDDRDEREEREKREREMRER